MGVKSASHDSASGSPQFSWRVKAIDDTRGRFVCECKTHPNIVGFGDSERSAILQAKAAMAKAIDTDAVGMPAPGSTFDAK